MKEWYALTLHSQLGPRQGTLMVESEGNRLRGVLRLLGRENAVWGERKGSQTMELSHSLRTALGEHTCQSTLHITGETLSGTARLPGCKMTWSGKRLSREAQEKEANCE